MASDPHRKLDKEAASGRSEIHTIVVEAVGADGKPYQAELDLNLPRGSRITSVRERRADADQRPIPS